MLPLQIVHCFSFLTYSNMLMVRSLHPSSLPGCRSDLLVPFRPPSPLRAHARSCRPIAALNTEPYSSPVSTPHSGYHFDGTPRRFFEGWYWRVTLPGDGQSFALIYSIEDPLGTGQFSGIGAQVMGPDDGYLLQYSRDVSQFWADRSTLALGATFRPVPGALLGQPAKGMLAEPTFNGAVAQGFQASTGWHQGRIVASEGSAAGDLKSTVPHCEWAFGIRPRVGWGDQSGRQRATAGWLASLPVFEPHWQVLMAHGEATGWIEWGGERYEFTDAPAYAEKNWGGGFPTRWAWIQCNSFQGHPGTSVTAVGARRGLLQVPGFQEDVGMIGIHHNGTFYELNVKDSEVRWEVEPWGRWVIEGSNAQYDAVIEAECQSPGTPLRAPTADLGLAPFCRDSFAGKVRIRVWAAGGKDAGAQPLLDCVSEGWSGAVEVGGGPWWAAWSTEARMAEPVRRLLNLPLDVEALGDMVPSWLRPPGL